MLYELLNNLSSDFSFFNVTKYITFRAMIAMLSALFISFVFSPWFIKKLQKKQIGQVIRSDGPESHFSKAGTPTMGGGLLLVAVLLPTLLWMDISNHFVWYAVIVTAGYGLLGFVDDYMKINKKNTKGVSGKMKLLCQFLIAGAVTGYHYYVVGESGELTIPFLKDTVINLGFFYIPFAMVVIVGSSNAVNLTDGLDGLAIGPVMIAAACFAVLTYVTGNSAISEYLHYHYIPGTGELAIFAATLVGAGLGFLWYNTYPAQVFMGDVGSLPLGGALGVIAVFSKHEILLVIIGGIFVLEAVSVITQVASFKLTGKRIFRMAPIHHHFELKGWPEPKVIVRFWIIAIILAMVGLLNLKLR
ncbi:phospho-N-acetylmuramoyl-pentapeptide-transferase [bacterium]|nr:phospho-N-acetylmuramoyl-pentapeptide-transferase [bacterium]